jgi:hypothetical protein
MNRRTARSISLRSILWAAGQTAESPQIVELAGRANTMTSRFRHRGVKAIPAVVILLLYGGAAGLAGAEDQIGNFAGSGRVLAISPDCG